MSTDNVMDRRQRAAGSVVPERRVFQRRRMKRYEFLIPVTLEFCDHTITAECLNLSAGGLRILAPVFLPVDTKLMLQMSFNRNMSVMGFAGVVRNTTVHEPGGSAYKSSIMFTDIGEVERKILHACLEELEGVQPDGADADRPHTPTNRFQILLTDKLANMNRLARRRVAITGLGVISPIGIGKEAFLQALIEGRSGIGMVTRFDVSQLPTKLAAEVNGFDPLSFISPRKLRQMDRCTQMAVAAAILGLADGGVNLEKINREHVGVLIGTAIGGLRWAFEQNNAFQAGGYRNIDPRSMIATYPNAVSGQVSIEIGAKGRTDTISSGCASAGTAFGVAADLIQRGELNVVLVGGTENPIEPTVFSAMCAAGALSTLNDVPARTPRPFDAERDGPILGEGAGVLVFEELEHALQRGATIYGEFRGFGTTSDAFSLSRTDPTGTQATRAVRMALQNASLAPGDIDFVTAYGIATPSCDWAEARVMKDVFGERAGKIPVTAIQSMTGYPWAAIGAFQLVTSCLAISQGIVPPTLNYTVPDPNCDLNIARGSASQCNVTNALTNLFGCGKNVSLITSRFSV
jgi:3-oxoacyl-[acyl-carrier-protein] synthase II